MTFLILLLLAGGAGFYFYTKRKANSPSPPDNLQGFKPMDYRTNATGVPPQKQAPALWGRFKSLGRATQFAVIIACLLPVGLVAYTFRNPYGGGYQQSDGGSSLGNLVGLLSLFLFLGLVVFLFYRGFQTDAQISKIKKSGYRAVPTWRDHLTTRDKVERSQMPPFRVYYLPRQYSEATRDGVWTHGMDGNSSIPSNGPPRTFIQWCPNPVRRSLELYEVTREVGENLARGPEESRRIVCKTIRGEARELNIPCGTPGGKWPTARAQTDAHGTAQPAGLGNMNPAPDPHGSAQAGGLGDMHLRS